MYSELFWSAFSHIRTQYGEIRSKVLKPYFLKKLDIEEALVSNEIFSIEKYYKYFLGYLYNDHKVKPLQKTLPKTSNDVKSYDVWTRWIYFLNEGGDLLQRYNTIWDKVSAGIKK